MELKIYDKANNLRLTASPNSSSTVTEEIGGECSVSASFTHTAYVPLDVDDYIDLEGVRYKVKSRYRPKQKNTQTYEYSVKFYAPLHDAEDTLMLFQEGGTTSEFSYDGGPREHLQLWIDNMNRRAGGNLWSIGTVITADNKTIDYRNVKCWDAAFGSNGIAATFETEMWADGYVINLCKAERGEMVELGYLHGLTNLAQEDNGEVKFFTRLFPLGSTRNIDATKYGYSRLQLPDRSLYVDKNIDLYGVKEETEEAAFSEIYPQYVGTVSSVRTEEKTSEEGRKYTVYYFKDNGMTWNPKDYKIPDLDYMLEFQTGELAGRGTDGSFQAAWHEDTKEWEIINVYPDDTTQIPGGAIVPKSGDQYIPWNFAMPQEYITAAEQEYKQAVNDFLNTYSFDPNKYNGTTDRNYIEKNGTPLRIGWNVRLLSEQYFGSTGGYKDTRIIKVQRKLNDLCQATITCSDEVGTGWKSSVDNRLNNLQYVLSQKQEQEVIDIIKTTDNKTPSDYNVFSALKAIGMFLRKDVAEQVKYVMTFLKGIVVKGTAKFGNFITGVSGGMIDDEGNMEMESGYFRKRLFVPEIAYNRITYFKGRAVISPGGGCKVKSYIKNDDGSFTVIPDLTEADGLSQFVDDILSAFFTTKNEEGKLTGFAQMQFRVTEADYDAKTFKIVNRPGNNYEPGEEMILAQTGNFTNPERQTYILFDTLNGNNCITFFDNANTWDPEPAQMKSWLGKKKGMKVQGFDCDNYSAVLQNILMTGLIFQTDTITGQPIRVPLDKGAWEAGPHAYFDRVSHNGSLWLCINPEGTESEPADNNPDWLKQVAEGQRGLQGLQGEKGEQGIPGPKGETGATGAAGKTSYFHIKYSNDGGKTFTGNNGEDVGDWMGTYVDFTQADSSSVSSYKWMKTKGAQGAKGDQGIPGTNGTNGQTSYLHIAYANSADGSSGFSTSDSTNKLYIGQYTDFTQADSNDYKKYSWSRIKGDKGDKGDTGPTGSQGIPGTSSYFHVKYSANSNGNPMSDTPNTYIGTAVTQSSTAPTSYTSYKWARFQGAQGPKGDQGIQGPAGANGKTSYLHIKYSNDGGKSFTANNGETPGAYIGQYVDFTQADSSSVSSYTWTKVKGDKGDKGDTGSAGVGVKSVDVLYYMSTSATSLSGGSWQTTSPEWVNGKYMWSKTKVTYTDETTKETAPVCITGAKGNTGATGNTGAAGKGVKSIVEEYYLSASSSSTTGGSWSTTVPAWQNGKYMWTRSVITYTDNSKTTTNAVCVSGSKGDKGDKGNTGATGPQGPQGTPGQNGTPGASFIPCGAWISGNVPYKKNSAVEFAENAFVALRDTSAPPYAIAKYNNGNYVRTPQGYLLAGTPSTNTLHPDWQRLTNIESPTLYWLDSSCSSIAYTSTGSMSPSAFTVSCKKNRNGVVGKCAELWLVARKYDGSWRSHAGPVQSASISVPAASGCTQFAVRAYWSSSEANAWSDNYVAEIGIGVAEAGATGATGAFPRDRGPWRSGESYEWSADYRDKVIHPFNGVYYNFLVRTQGSTVTDAPTSANGDDNWEAMNKLVNIATDTLFSDGANVAGFMFSGGVMKSQQSTNGVANMILNGNTGYFHCVNAEITGKFIGNISADSGTIGGFSIGAKSLSNLAADVSLSIGNYNNSSTKLFSVNRGTSAMLQVRHDSGICISAETHGSSDSIAIRALCNASGYGQAIQAYGNVSLLARRTEKTRINGVVVNTRRITSSATINANDDFLIFGNSGNITVTMPSTSASPAGKILYMKRVSGSGAITLSGSFRNPNNSGGASSLVINDDVSRFFVRDDQGYWVQYTCG